MGALDQCAISSSGVPRLSSSNFLVSSLATQTVRVGARFFRQERESISLWGDS